MSADERTGAAMGWKKTLDEAIVAADLRRARRGAGLNGFQRASLLRRLEAAARDMHVALPADAGALHLAATDDRAADDPAKDDPVGATVELLQRARLGRASAGLARADLQALYWQRLDADRKHGPARRRRARLLAALAVAVAAVGLTLAIALPSAPSAPLTSPATGRLSPADEEIFADTLTSFSIALDALSRARADGATLSETRALQDRVRALHAKATLDPPATLLGPDVTAALDTFLTAAEGATRPGRSAAMEDARLATTLRDVNRALAAASRPYFLDHATFTVESDGGPRVQVALFAFHIEATRLFRGPGAAPAAPAAKAITAHIVRRIDTLSVRQHLLGYTKRGMDVALVRADLIATTTRDRLGPALPPPDGTGGPLALPAPPGADAAAWDALLTHAGSALRDALTAAKLPLTADALTTRHAEAVLTHEAQHRVDYDGPPLPVPPAIAALSDGDAAFSERAAHELSAYTAELVHDPAWAKVCLMNLLGHLGGGSESAEAISAALILSGLAAALGDSGPALTAGERFDARRATALMSNLLTRKDTDIAAAARKLWAGWFGRELPALVVESADTGSSND